MAACISLAPVADAKSRVLVLGSMPGRVSLDAAQYYAHPRNAFWRIVSDLWDVPMARDFPARIETLHARRVALWDVLYACEREGSLDTAIRNAIPNDFASFFRAHAGIRAVILNGRAAFTFYHRLVMPHVQGPPCYAMPSTSPAHTMPYAEKLARWQWLKTCAEEAYPL